MGSEQIREIFANNLRTLLQLSDKKQADVLRDLGIKQTTFSSWCNGTKFPRADKLDWLATYFGVSREALISENLGEAEENNVLDGYFQKVQYAGPIAAHFNATPTELHEYWPCRRNGWDTASPRISLLPWWTATPCTRIIKTVIISFVCGALIWSIPGASVLCFWRAARQH